MKEIEHSFQQENIVLQAFGLSLAKMDIIRSTIVLKFRFGLQKPRLPVNAHTVNKRKTFWFPVFVSLLLIASSSQARHAVGKFGSTNVELGLPGSASVIKCNWRRTVTRRLMVLWQRAKLLGLSPGSSPS